ncbi:MAG TPA: molybdate ABC transporter substrate-binding protein [Candidatus Udaeobacter sp.]|nr:molybdate ABC transporter substrate-binding protein [Candidatus Udaeobacter sp.]
MGGVGSAFLAMVLAAGLWPAPASAQSRSSSERLVAGGREASRRWIHRRLMMLALVFLAALAAAGPVLGGELVVFAAASLTDALKDLGQSYEESTRVHVIYNFAASNLLARQIAAGAPADLFASADEEKMDWLAKKGTVVESSRIPLLSNTLAIVVGADSRLVIQSEADLAKPDVRSIALAEPQSVPAGIYAKQHLEKLGLWKQVIDRVIPTENVRAALAAVESGNVDAGIVYRTDAAISNKVKIAYEVPRAEGPKISYPFAVLKSSSDPAAAQRFLDYLASPAGRAVFTRYGFLTPEP